MSKMNDDKLFVRVGVTEVVACYGVNTSAISCGRKTEHWKATDRKDREATLQQQT
jgi:hypothetical protein